MKRKRDGFTLTESLVSLLLAGLATIFIMKCLMVSINGMRNSRSKFSVEMALENRKNFLLGVEFHSPFLKPGNYDIRQGTIFIRIRVTDLEPALKRIRMTGTRKDYTSRTVFYRSEIIGGNT